MKKLNLKRYKNKLWKLFSEYIRRRDRGRCFTCGDTRPWKEQQAGHFKHGVLDFDEMNINCQCVRCNKWLHGNGGEYAIRLIIKYGMWEVKELYARIAEAKKGKKETWEWYEERISYYQDALVGLDMKGDA